MRGFVEDSSWPLDIPTDMWVSTDTDLLVDVNNGSIKLLAQKENNYLVVKLDDATTHIMNKFSLDKLIDKEFANE
jgi:hypothetical protein